MSDALQHPPSFDQMVSLIEKLFKDYLTDVRKNAITPESIEKAWQRYKTLNHLWQEEVPHFHKESVEENWDSFWKSIVTNEDGTINIDQVKKELHDFSFMMEQVPKVYCHVTGNRMSKVMYHADTVISVADDYFQEQLDEAIREAAQPVPGLPPLPEPILTDEDVKDWEGEKEQPGPAWVKGRYDKLYDQVKGGKRVVCYVDYIARGADKVYRDICTVNPGGMEFVARGISYGSVKYIEGDERTNFIGLCEMKNVEWLDESGTTAIEWDSIRLVGRVKDRFKELEEKQHDWRSFYCAWLEGRVDMLQQIKGRGRLYELSQQRADLICEANNRDLEGVVGREDAVKAIAVAFMRWNSHMYKEGIDRQQDKWFNHKGECVANSTPDLYDQFYELIIKQGNQPWLLR